MKRLFYVAPVLMISLWVCDAAQAQVTDAQRARRRALVEDLLRGLIESQVDPPPRMEARPPGQLPTQPGRQPGTTLPTRDPNSRPPATAQTSELVAARNALRQWSIDSQMLVTELRAHEHESPELKPLLADALRLQAAIAGLETKAGVYPTVQPLVNDFALIDRDWRTLGYRLQQSSGLPRDCRQYVNSIMKLDDQLCRLFSIEPQLNRQELIRLSAELNSDFRHLLQDIYYQMRGTAAGRAAIQEGQELYTLINQTEALIPNGNYESIVRSYKVCLSQWRGFSRQLRGINDPQIQRNIQQIEARCRTIQEYLWLPIEMDRDYILHVTSSVGTEASNLFAAVSLNQLLACEQPGNVMNAARDFQIGCDNFARSVQQDKSVEDLAWEFKLFRNQWDKVHHFFHELESPQIDARLEDIEFSIRTLGETFGDGLAMNHQDLVNLLAALDQYCHGLSDSIHRRVTSQQYGRQFHRDICGMADVLQERVHELHRNVLAQRGGEIDISPFNEMFRQWVLLKPKMNECQPQDREAFMELRRQIEPLMVKLQVVFSE